MSEPWGFPAIMQSAWEMRDKREKITRVTSTKEVVAKDST